MKGQGHKLKWCFLACDLLVVAASWVSSYWIRFYSPYFPPAINEVPPFLWNVRTLPLILFLAWVSLRHSRLYQLHRLRQAGEEIKSIIQATLLMFLFIILVNFYLRDPYRSRLALGVFFAVNTVALILTRRVAWSLVHWLRGHGYNPSQALIVGTGRMAQKLAHVLRKNTWTGLEPIGFVDKIPHRIIGGLPVLGTLDELVEIIEGRDIGYVFVALPLNRYGEIRHVMRQLADSVVDVRLVPDLPNLAAMSLGVSVLDGLPVLGLRENPHYGPNQFIKRSMDIVISSLALVVLSPVFLLIALLIKLTSPGPILFRQERASLGGERFQMLKFRSMRVDAEHHSGPVWAVRHDPRRTGVGEILRKTSLDELPQFINVLKGDMSLVGPRPERPVFIQKFRQSVPNYMVRHKVKAGITGWAQIHGWRGNTSLRKRVQYDLYYITHWSPWLDIRILVMTLFRGMASPNAY